MRSYFKQIIPEGIKSRIRQSDLWNYISALRLASSSKRLDLCAAQFAHVLHLSGNTPIRDKVCLEIGSGWVLSHALICHLLGAKKVIATDLSHIAYPSCLYKAIHRSIPSIVRDILSPFEEHSEIRRRLDNLLSIKTFTFDTLERIGIEYIAPINLVRQGLNIPLDFIYSFSVLEHVPIEDILALLKNINNDLQPGGTIIHCIHLEDHKDIRNDPFAFLSHPADTYSQNIQGNRGNRLRMSQWCTLFSQIEGIDSRVIYEWSRLDRDLPEKIDSSIIYNAENDLRISHIGVYGIKKRTDY